MKNIWNTISSLGLTKNNHSLEHRSIILTNRLNLVTLLVFILLLITTIIVASVEKSTFGMGTYRSVYMIILCCIIFVLAKNGQTKTARILLVFFPPIVILVFPTLTGFIEEESFVYYPYVILIMSIFPQLLITPQKEKKLYAFALLYYFILVISIDVLLLHAGNGSFKIIPIILSFYVWYKIIPIALFLFLTFSIYYLRSLNTFFEKEIKRKNKTLDLQNETLKSTIQELNKTQAKLIHSEKMAALGNLTSGIAHEINNPLNYIAGGSFLMEEVLEEFNESNEFNNEQLSKALSMIESGINRATRVVQLLSVFSNNNEISKSNINLDDIIDGTLCFIAVKTEGIINIEKKYEPNVKVEVFQDQIHKVLLSIFENAVEAILNDFEKGAIKISTYCKTNENKAVIEIWNSGNTIEEKDLLRVFNPFFSTKNHKMNSGLGLTVAYNIIQEHGGDISIQNADSGVKVKITLPITQNENSN